MSRGERGARVVRSRFRRRETAKGGTVLSQVRLFFSSFVSFFG